MPVENYFNMTPYEKRVLGRTEYAFSRVHWDFDLGNIPNHSGYRFLALMIDGTLEWCEIGISLAGGYAVRNDRFQFIMAWRANQWEGNRDITVGHVVNDFSI